MSGSVPTAIEANRGELGFGDSNKHFSFGVDETQLGLAFTVDLQPATGRFVVEVFSVRNRRRAAMRFIRMPPVR